MKQRQSRSREDVLRMLRRAGYPPEIVDEVAAQLPDTIDLVRDRQLLERYGLSADQLMDRLGGSP